jgi:hypothetical protein
MHHISFEFETGFVEGYIFFLVHRLGVYMSTLVCMLDAYPSSKVFLRGVLIRSARYLSMLQRKTEQIDTTDHSSLSLSLIGLFLASLLSLPHPDNYVHGHTGEKASQNLAC